MIGIWCPFSLVCSSFHLNPGLPAGIHFFFFSLSIIQKNWFCCFGNEFSFVFSYYLFSLELERGNGWGYGERG